MAVSIQFQIQNNIIMTVQELINKLQEIKDNSKEVQYLDNEDFGHSIYDILDCDIITYLY